MVGLLFLALSLFQKCPRSSGVFSVIFPHPTGVGPNGTSTSTLPEEVCSLWRDWRTWTDDQKSQVKTLVLDEMDALGNFMFWTWKIGVSDVLGYASAAEWHYQVRGRVFRSSRRSLRDNLFRLDADLHPSSSPFVPLLSSSG